MGKNPQVSQLVVRALLYQSSMSTSKYFVIDRHYHRHQQYRRDRGVFMPCAFARAKNKNITSHSRLLQPNVNSHFCTLKSLLHLLRSSVQRRSPMRVYKIAHSLPFTTEIAEPPTDSDRSQPIRNTFLLQAEDDEPTEPNVDVHHRNRDPRLPLCNERPGRVGPNRLDHFGTADRKEPPGERRPSVPIPGCALCAAAGRRESIREAAGDCQRK